MKKFGIIIAVAFMVAGFGIAIFISFRAHQSINAYRSIDTLKNTPTPAPTPVFPVPAQGSDQPAPTGASGLPPGFKMPEFIEQEVRVENKNIQLKENPTDEEVKEYIAEVQKRAVATDAVAIDGCVPEPTIVKISRSAPLKFTNGDEMLHTVFVAEPPLLVPAKGSAVLAASFASGTGVYNYDCDGHFSVGTFWVVE